MNHLFDEFSKSLAEPLPRRESLRQLGAALAGAVLSPLGLGTAWARGPDPCKTFCTCRNKSQQNACLAACNACNKDTNRIAGKCGTYVCCPTARCSGVCSDLRSDPNCGACGNNCSAIGQSCCGNYCADLAGDFYNCGSCGNVCDQAGPNEYGVCLSGNCEYPCIEGAAFCNGACTFLDSDPANCGGCSNVCPGSAPWCVQGACSECTAGLVPCGDSCVDTFHDPDNCGTCGVQCAETEVCMQGVCGECAPGLTPCGGYCVDLLWDQYNCGTCGRACDPYYEVCEGGSCNYYGGGGGGGGCHGYHC